MARTSNATQLSAALTRAEMAETALKDALAQIELLNMKLTTAREIFVAQRDALRAARPAPKVQTEAQRAYAARAVAGRIAFAKACEARKANSVAFFAAHPDATSATDSQIAEWVEAQAIETE